MNRLFQDLRNFRGAAMLSLLTRQARAEVVAWLQAIALVGFVALLSAPTSATAAVVTVAATEFPRGFITENVTVKGFRFSPSCHFDITDVQFGWPSDLGTTFLGIDGSACGSPHATNPNYLGPDGSGVALYIDAGGKPFTLLDLKFYGWMESLISSKGGEFSGGATFDESLGDLNTNIWTETFDGGKWTGVKWLTWLFPNNAGEPTDGIINLTLRLPEPGMLALLSLGLAGLAFTRRRKQ